MRTTPSGASLHTAFTSLTLFSPPEAMIGTGTALVVDDKAMMTPAELDRALRLVAIA